MKSTPEPNARLIAESFTGSSRGIAPEARACRG